MKRKIDVQIQRLLECVEAELIWTSYGARIIKKYQTVWCRLADYMKDHYIAAYSTKTGLDFLEAAYQITVFKALTNENKVRARSIQVLNDYHLYGVIFPK